MAPIVQSADIHTLLAHVRPGKAGICGVRGSFHDHAHAHAGLCRGRLLQLRLLLLLERLGLGLRLGLERLLSEIGLRRCTWCSCTHKWIPGSTWYGTRGQWWLG